MFASLKNRLKRVNDVFVIHGSFYWADVSAITKTHSIIVVEEINNLTKIDSDRNEIVIKIIILTNS